MNSLILCIKPILVFQVPVLSHVLLFTHLSLDKILYPKIYRKMFGVLFNIYFSIWTIFYIRVAWDNEVLTRSGNYLK